MKKSNIVVKFPVIYVLYTSHKLKDILGLSYLISKILVTITLLQPGCFCLDFMYLIKHIIIGYL